MSNLSFSPLASFSPSNPRRFNHPKFHSNLCSKSNLYNGIFQERKPVFPRKKYWVTFRRTRIHAKKSAEPHGKVQSSNEKVISTLDARNGSSPSTRFLSILCPLLKLFGGGDPSQERNYSLEVATSSLSSVARFLWGSRSLSDDLDSQQVGILEHTNRLQLFEFEACPFCRRVREAITELDLSVEIYPCPKGSLRHREIVRRLGGKEQFPFLVDPNVGISMYESSDIVKYLFRQYGEGRSPSIGLLESTLISGWMPTLLRAGRGMALWEMAQKESPPRKLELFSFENNPYARIVREALCELELPYILQTVGKGSRRTKLLLETSGSKEVPYIIDPNTGTQIGDFRKILGYLFKTYSMVTV